MFSTSKYNEANILGVSERFYIFFCQNFILENIKSDILNISPTAYYPLQLLAYNWRNRWGIKTGYFNF